MSAGTPHQGTSAPVILTPGDPAGIGSEISLKAFAAGLRGFILMEDPERLAAMAARLGLDVPIEVVEAPVSGPFNLASDHEALPVLALSWDTAPLPGNGDPRNAARVIDSIRRAAAMAQDGHVAAIVTNPIHKSVLIEAGFPHPGHTEFLASLAPPRTGAPMMMLASEMLRVVPATVHIALRDVPDALTTDGLVAKGRLLEESLRIYFGCATPRIAFCGLNPHAGEDGQFGDEDSRIIAPAVETLKAEGMSAFGPLSADTLFHPQARASYDAVIGMYHDQVLIPLKTLDFDGGINITLGLDFIRTSPDHGTAFDLAGTGKARPDSLIAAIRMAQRMARMKAAHACDHG
ncbi:MAG: 4-hydroxythreonine-4-phosphate dehydrogenase PdxA [Pseudomonadota bacterium]|nr:4-hydroxythreonine-4-phosphate dehydrogenase PdxA [Pseudomonadota bacterium]